MQSHKFTVINTAGNNPLEVKPEKQGNFVTQILLHAYSITDISVTSGVPDSLIYSIIIESHDSSANYGLRTDQKSGYPLRLTGAFTTENCDTPIVVCEFEQPVFIDNFTIRLKDVSGVDAVFEKYVFWMELILAPKDKYTHY